MLRLPRHSRRRWVRLSLFSLLLLVTLALGWVLLGSDKQFGSDQLVTWVGLFVSLAALTVSVADLFPPLAPPADTADLADNLAVTVREQWEEEVTVRRLRDPQVIPLTWAATSRPVVASPDAVVGSVGGRVLRLSFDGRLDGGFDTACVRLAEGYRQVDSGRLVILGEPGAGKTVLAAMLTLGLLAERDPGAPVPVLLQVSGWDPVSVSLNDWMVAELARAYYGGQEEVPRRLLGHRRLLAVLDGLDEMPEASRRGAVRAINETCGQDRGVVVTCRSAEYQDVIEGGSPVLRRAPVVEVAPVSVADGIAYLSEVSWPEHVAWEPVYAHLRTRAAGPLATALSTPLALTLARTVYSNTSRDPAELLAFDSAHAVEDHLVDHLVTAAYAPPPGSRGEQAGDAWLRKARRAEGYLTFLATYLHQQRERELDWWLMGRHLLPQLTGVVMGIVVALITMAVTSVGNIVVDGDLEAVEVFGYGSMFGALAAIIWYGASHRPPGRLSFARSGSLGRMLRGFAGGAKLTILIVAPVLVAEAAYAYSMGAWDLESYTAGLTFLASAVGAGLAVSLSLAAYSLLDAAPERATGASPSSLLRQDRTSSLSGALAAGITLGVAGSPLTVLTTASASLGTVFLTHSPPRLPHGALDLLPTLHDAYHQPWGTSVSGPAATTLSLSVPAAGFAFLVLLTRPWTRFLILRAFLAARGRAPWQLMRFLTEARNLQLLRQSGGSYQFRHIRLQERLAGRSLAQDRAPVSPRRGSRPVRWAPALLALLLVGGFTIRHGLPEDHSQIVIRTGHAHRFTGFAPGTQHTLVTVDAHGSIHRWNTRTGEERETHAPRVHFDSETRLPFGTAQHNGLLLLFRSYGDDGTSGLSARFFPWDGARSRMVSLPPHFPASATSMSSGGRYAVLPGNGFLQVRPAHALTTEPSSCRIPVTRAPWQFLTAIDAKGERTAYVEKVNHTIHVYDHCLAVEDIEIPWDVPPGGRIAFNDAGTRLAVTKPDGTVWLFAV